MKNERRYFGMLIFLCAAALFTQYLTYYRIAERTPGRRPLSGLPDQAGRWKKIDARTLGSDQARELNADDYLSRTYVNDRGMISYLFTAFYASQRYRQTVHSPQNCIPGAGWTMSNHRLHSLKFDSSRTGEVNEYSIEKDGVRMLAFYWYQGRGRIVAGDYLGRFLIMRDALLIRRTDGALVRVIIPIADNAEAESRSRAAGLDFVATLVPMLSDYIPD
jgi:EpsI family protein